MYEFGSEFGVSVLHCCDVCARGWSDEEFERLCHGGLLIYSDHGAGSKTENPEPYAVNALSPAIHSNAIRSAEILQKTPSILGCCQGRYLSYHSGNLEYIRFIGSRT